MLLFCSYFVVLTTNDRFNVQFILYKPDFNLLKSNPYLVVPRTTIYFL